MARATLEARMDRESGYGEHPNVAQAEAKPRANRGLGKETLVDSNTCSDAAMLKTACNGKQEKRTFECKWGRTRQIETAGRKWASRKKKTRTCLGHPEYEVRITTHGPATQGKEDR
jgi:hypothetical protein